MSQLSGIYDSDVIQPVAKIKENLSIWTTGQWSHFRIDYLEPIPPGPASTVDMVAAAGLTTLAANAAIAKRVVAILQLNDTELLHVRFEPIENVEGVIWEQSGQAKFNSRSIHARVDRNTRQRDPHLVTTTFWILGANRDMQLEVRNPMAVATPLARFIFWGYRALLSAWDFSKYPDDVKAALKVGDVEVVRKIMGATTWLPAEGRQA